MSDCMTSAARCDVISSKDKAVIQMILFSWEKADRGAFPLYMSQLPMGLRTIFLIGSDVLLLIVLIQKLNQELKILPATNSDLKKNIRN